MTDDKPQPHEHPEHHLEHETAKDVVEEQAMLAKAIGGWRGMIDTALPAAAFVIVYVLNGNQLTSALIVAVAIGLVVAVLRLIRRESLQQIIAGFVGVAVSAFVARQTGQAEDFFLPGLLLNTGYLVGFVVSILIRWPLIGIIVGFLTKGDTSWRRNPELRHAYAAASWVWVGLFGLRLLVQVPLYLAGQVAALGTLKILMGWPLYLAAVYISYRVVAPAWKKSKESGSVAE